MAAPGCHEADVLNCPFMLLPVLARTGSLLTWHGTGVVRYRGRQRDCMSPLVQDSLRRHMRPLHLMEGTVSPEMLQKFPELECKIGKSLHPFDEAVDGSLVTPFMLTGTHRSA